jgi:uncharacterized protein YuzE
MKDRYLEITYRKGKPFAAYFYLVRPSGTPSVRSEKVADGLVADYDDTGRAIGLEIVAPSAVTLESIRNALERLDAGPVDERELAPLRAA